MVFALSAVAAIAGLFLCLGLTSRVVSVELKPMARKRRVSIVLRSEDLIEIATAVCAVAVIAVAQIAI